MVVVRFRTDSHRNHDKFLSVKYMMQSDCTIVLRSEHRSLLGPNGVGTRNEHSRLSSGLLL